jgi:hypothetical protein
MLQKDDIGKSRTSVRALPGEYFSYGKPLPRDLEGAGDCNIFIKFNIIVTTKWKFHESKKLGGTDKDFKTLNKIAI